MVRALALYAGALLGVVVYSGLVDRDLWGHVRRWAAVMVALILVKPVTVIVLGLAATLESTGEHGPVITGIGVTALSLMAAIYIIAKLPGLGDTIRAGRIVARTTGAAVGTVAGAASASADVMRGIQTHSSRTVPQKGNTARNSGASQGVTGGLGAHSNRQPRKSDPGSEK
ncbi:hypothetical protein ACFQ1B_37620 [Streptomyces mexicanus]